MRHVNELYLGWYSESRRAWYTVGRFTCDSSGYSFQYLAGAVKARNEAGFGGVRQFPDFEREYHSPQLFAFLSNRLLSKNRPEYEAQTARLGLEPSDLKPFDILSRTSGRRATDTYELYPAPSQENGSISLHFFARGVRYLTDTLKDIWENEPPTEPLCLRREPDNPRDQFAIEIYDGDERKMGYIPRYYSESLSPVIDADCEYDLQLVRHNRAPGYVRQRFLLHLTAHIPNGWHFPQSSQYAPIDNTGDSPDTETDAA